MAEILALVPTSPLFYVVGLGTIVLMAISKGAFGGGVAIIGVPFLAVVVDPIVAAIMLAPLVVIMDLFALKGFPPSTWSMPDLKPLLIGLLAGIAVGWLTFEWVDRRIVILLIALITLAFTARWFLKDRLRPPPPHGVRPRMALGLGSLAGFTTFVAHSGGPPVALYLLGRGLNKTMFAGTTAAVFTCGNLIKLGPYLKLGIETPQALVAAAVLAPVIPFGVLIGRWLHHRLDERELYFWCYVLLALSGTKLLYDAIRAFV
jgi:hypothetical protein